MRMLIISILKEYWIVFIKMNYNKNLNRELEITVNK